jgi:hypothetical protein
MDGENYQAMFVCGRAAAWDKPRSERVVGRQMPPGFGKKDECGFLPKAATPGWK